MLREKPGGSRLWGKPPGKFPSLDSGKSRPWGKAWAGGCQPIPKASSPSGNPCSVGLSPFLLPKGQGNKRGGGGRERSKRNFFQLLRKRKALFRQEEYPVELVTKQPTAMWYGLRDRQGTKLPHCPPTAHQGEPAGPGDRGHHQGHLGTGSQPPRGAETPSRPRAPHCSFSSVTSLTQASLVAAQEGFLVWAPSFPKEEPCISDKSLLPRTHTKATPLQRN